MTNALKALIEILTVTPCGEGVYQGAGSAGDGAEGTYGGHFLGQASAAALASVGSERNLHSLHAYFLRAGRPGVEIEYAVSNVRDGRSFCTRRVTATQNGGPAIFELTASFTVAADGPVIDPDPPEDFDRLPEPLSLPPYRELMASLDPLPLPAEWSLREHGIDVRVVNAPWSPNGSSDQQGIRNWIRADGALPDDPKLHAALLAYQSDESISDNVLVPFGVTWGSPGVFFVSLDHAMWYHRPARMDQWLFVEQFPVVAAHERGVSTGRVWNRAGKLVASFTQEALMRI